jgi:chaperonin GroES
VAEPLSGSGRLPIRMLHDRVLVRTPGEDGERRSTGGILIPPTAQVAATRLVWAEVLAVGNHVRVIEVGDRVLFSPDDPRCRASSI